MKKIHTILVLILLVFVALPVTAGDGGHHHHDCPHSGATITDLQNCIAHAAEMGHISNQGVLRGLQAKLDSAQSALDRGQVGVAVNNLNAFINLAEAQSGQHIHGPHAAHMIHHAERVIAALS